MKKRYDALFGYNIPPEVRYEGEDLKRFVAFCEFHAPSPWYLRVWNWCWR